MNAKTLRYVGSQGFSELLSINFPKPFFWIAANTYHLEERVGERAYGLSDKQRAILFKIKLGIVRFSVSQVSEIRVIGKFIISIVIDDVVFAVHPVGLPENLIVTGYGTREGEGWGVVKTILHYPNARPIHKSIDGFEIV